MTPPHEQAEQTADKAIDALRSAVDEIARLKAYLQRMTEAAAEVSRLRAGELSQLQAAESALRDLRSQLQARVDEWKGAYGLQVTDCIVEVQALLGSGALKE